MNKKVAAPKGKSKSLPAKTKASKRVAKTSPRQLRLYNKIVDVAELGDINLVRCDLKVDPLYALGGIDEESGKVSRNYGCAFEGESFSPSSGIAAAVFRWNLTIKVGRKSPFKLTCDYLCHYYGLENQDEEAAKAFVRRVGKFATYPYFRTKVSQLSWETGVELPRLPILRQTVPLNTPSPKKAKKS